MDSETGEFYPDFETGEICYYTPSFNSETGEEERINYNHLQCPSNRRPFKIPQTCVQRYSENNCKKFKNNQKISQGLIDPIVFLLPTTICFYPVLGIILVVLEVFLHHWSHKQNKLLKNTDQIYYQSPLHFICREFCAVCREESMKLKITKIQDIRNTKLKYGLEYVRRVVT